MDDEPTGGMVSRKATQCLQFNEMLIDRLRHHPEPNDPRDKMALRAAIYASELHKAMATLIREGQNGPAFVLARPLIEAAISALYLLCRVTKEGAEGMVLGQKGLPNASDMVKKCRNICEYGPNLERVWSGIAPLHKLTHGDTMQINRRMASDSSEEQAFWMLTMADGVVLSAFEVAAVALCDTALQADIISIRDVLATRLMALTGKSHPGPLSRLPMPDRST